LGDRSNFLHGINGADLVVGSHDAQQVNAAGTGLL